MLRSDWSSARGAGLNGHKACPLVTRSASCLIEATPLSLADGLPETGSFATPARAGCAKLFLYVGDF